ncbi:uncharacterized protein LOC144100103 [Amblyomma americanum]
MQFQAALLVAIATVFVTEWQLSAGYAAFDRVPVVDGKCQHNGTDITPGEPLRVEFPCEEWSCTPDGELSIVGCGRVGAGRHCVLIKGTGVYPDCCERIACN